MAGLVQDRTVFAGLPTASWAFAVRIWLALVAALYISFWLELEAPTSAALTVAILALPTRGQGLEKAGVRVAATVIGVTASIAIFGAFSQTDGLLLAVLAAWIGLCVFAAGLLDGNRAYAAALGVITISLIAIQKIDSPQDIFEAGLARGAAIAVGILAVTLVNDLLAAPDYHPKIASDLAGLHRRAIAYAQSVLRGETVPPATSAGLLRAITSLRSEVSALSAESSSGPARSAAARNALVDLVGVVSVARELEALPVAATAPLAGQIASSLDGESAAALPPVSRGDDPDSGLIALSFAWLAGTLVERSRQVRDDLGRLRDGRFPSRPWKAPLYRSYRVAVENGVRAGLCFALAAVFFMVTGWPTTEISLSLVAILIGLGATAPDARAFTTLAVIAVPFACLIAGVLEFVILDGADAFPLLAIALAPAVIGPALLMTATKPAVAGMGRLFLIFGVAILAPTNPQSYNPQTFVFTVLFLCLATLLLFAIQILVPPLSGEDRLRRLLAGARHQATAPEPFTQRTLAPEEATFRDAGRIGQIVAAGAAVPAKMQCLDEAMACFDHTVAVRACAAALDGPSAYAAAAVGDAGRKALTRRDATGLLDVARSLYPAALAGDPKATELCARLTLASRAIAASPSAIFNREMT
ncbi:FUSC family protein [Starkeya sp. ORNL1]|uniref:FUSC family protein n=1 Tax=Starkeya sp. ORNL1 TaxID=2709380 RepID=UPI0014634681|nr:FUSC family protein [Starkeya sp. ORNL1]QJP13821.1 FUSC family protein [Starkeya sp. ORNL1]